MPNQNCAHRFINTLKKMDLYSDAHVHLNDRMQSILPTYPITAILSCSTPQQCNNAKQFIQRYPNMEMSCGIHPWHANDVKWEEMLPWLQQTTIIGEIGMDSVWCTIDLQSQKNIFIKQLAFASYYHKPVVLHTKGMEKEILDLIRQYPNHYHVHWYSCPDYIEEYRALNCYFSIGPFPFIDENVKKVVELVPLNRLLIETDGIEAAEWAMHQSLNNDAYLSILKRTAKEIATIKNKPVEEILYQTKYNLLKFLSIKAKENTAL
ncbi:TatD family hydrolase [Merdibacter massiliensis]|uniref:TatD family hydrolase n=1 Tax=Merdibacter massiliensis TaxID=1871030 RepID=UPI0009FB2DF1|nr:TatD family hydrolase [Merdibacter massiliensis]